MPLSRRGFLQKSLSGLAACSVFSERALASFPISIGFWQKRNSGPVDAMPASITMLKNSGTDIPVRYVSTISNGHTIALAAISTSQMAVVALNQSGAVAWAKTITNQYGASLFVGKAVAQLKNGSNDFVVAGYADTGTGTYIHWVICFSNDGTVRWQRNLSSSVSFAYMNAIGTLETLSNGNIAVASYHFGASGIVVLSGTDGSLVYHNKYTTSTGTLGFSGSSDSGPVFAPYAGGYYFLCDWSEAGVYGTRIFIAKMNNDGTVVWARSCGLSNTTAATPRAIAINEEGNVIASDSNSRWVKFDASGNLIWKYYSTASTELPMFMFYTDGKIVGAASNGAQVLIAPMNTSGATLSYGSSFTGVDSPGINNQGTNYERAPCFGSRWIGTSYAQTTPSLSCVLNVPTDGSRLGTFVCNGVTFTRANVTRSGTLTAEANYSSLTHTMSSVAPAAPITSAASSHTIATINTITSVVTFM